MLYKRASGSTIEISETKANIEYAKKAGWIEVKGETKQAAIPKIASQTRQVKKRRVKQDRN